MTTQASRPATRHPQTRQPERQFPTAGLAEMRSVPGTMGRRLQTAAPSHAKRSALAGIWALLFLAFLPGCGQRETPVETAAAEKTLLIGNGEEPAVLDPQLSTSVAEGHILFALFEGLVSPDPADPNEIVPGVASRWEFDSETRTYRFFLRPDARWSNGDPVTARDFVGAARRALSPKLGASYPEMYFDLTNAEAYYSGEIADFDEVGIRAIDDQTLELRLGRPGPDFLQKLKHFAWMPVPVAAIEALGALDDRSTRWATPGSMVSNGPFQLQAWTQNSFIETIRNPPYWDAANVPLQTIRFFPYEDAQVEYRAFLSGQLHVTDKIPVEHIGDPQQQPAQRADPFLATSYLIFNTASPQLANPELRRALALAIDRESLTRDINRSGDPASAFTPPGIEDYRAPQLPNYNPLEARERFHSVLGDNPAPEITFVVSNNPASRAIAEAVQGMWSEALGLDVALVNMEAKTLFSSLNAGDFDVSFLSWTGDYADPTTFLDLWRSENSKNRARWNNNAYDQLLDRAAHETEQTKRMALLADAEALLLEQAPIIPIIWKTKNYCITPSVENWPPALLDMRSYKRVNVSP